MCFVWIWEQTAIISLYSINWLVCITKTECVYCAVQTGSLYRITVYTVLIKLQHKALRATSRQDISERRYRFTVGMKLHLRDSCRNRPHPPPTSQSGDDFQVLDNLSTPLLIRYSELAGLCLHSVGNLHGSEGSQVILNKKFIFSLPLLAHTSHTSSELLPGSQMVIIANLRSHPKGKCSWKSHI